MGRLSNVYSEQMHLVVAAMGIITARLAMGRRQATVAAFGLVLFWG